MIRRLAAILLLAACGKGAAENGTTSGPVVPVASDSAGIRILSHDAAALASAPLITFDPAPLAVIEGSAEDEAADISTIIPQLFLPDGRLLGIDRQRQVIVVFAADGSAREEFGRQGSGPGEYGGIGSILPIGDGKYLVIDFRNGRISTFDPESGPGTEFAISDAMGMGMTTPAAMVDGKVLLYGGIFGGPEASGPPGFKTALLDTLTGETRRLFATAPEPDPEESGMRVVELPGGGRAVAAVRISGITMLSAFPSAFGWNGAFVVTDPNTYRFTWHDTTGAVTQVMRVARPRVAVTEKVWQDYISDFIDQMTGAAPAGSAGGGLAMTMMGGGTPDTAQMRQQMSGEEHADSLPSFDRTRLAPDGTLWVFDYRVPRTEGWSATAFDREGRILGRIVETTGYPPVAIGSDRMAFRTEDDLGIATITVRRVVMP